MTDVGGCPEIVEHGKTGLLIPVRDVQKLKEAVIWMERHPGERLGMGQEARMTAVHRYDHNLLTDKLITVHTRCLR